MPIAGQENTVKNETFGSKFKISIGRIQPKSPIRFSLNLIFSLEFQWSSGEQKTNEIFSGSQIPPSTSKGISQAKSPIKISLNSIFSLEVRWEFDGQEANKIFSGIQIPHDILKAFLQPNPQSKSIPICHFP